MKTKAIFQKCYGPTDQQTDRPTDIEASRVVFMRLKITKYDNLLRSVAMELQTERYQMQESIAQHGPDS